MDKIISDTKSPITRERLGADLAALGVVPGMSLLVHTSMSKLGWVPGGTQTLALALSDAVGAVGEKGTIVVPTHSGDLSEPLHWQNPPIPSEWFEEVRRSLPVYDSQMTPARNLGRFPETLRTWPGVVRSSHPHASFAALGARAETMVARHDLTSPLGTGSPLQTLYDLDASVLFLGTNYESNTAFHLAEDSLDEPPTIVQGAPMMVEGKRQWVKFTTIDYDADDFGDCGLAFESACAVKIGAVGNAEARLFSLRSSVDFARDWLESNRE